MSTVLLTLTVNPHRVLGADEQMRIGLRDLVRLRHVLTRDYGVSKWAAVRERGGWGGPYWHVSFSCDDPMGLRGVVEREWTGGRFNVCVGGRAA